MTASSNSIEIGAPISSAVLGNGKHNKVYRYRLYPTKHQAHVMEHTLDLCRWVYNETLATRKNSFEAYKNGAPFWSEKIKVPKGESVTLMNPEEGKRHCYSKHILYNSFFDTSRLMHAFKERRPEIATDVLFSVAREPMKRVDLAMKAFFRRVKSGETPGYPRFKGRDRYDSFTFPQPGGFNIVECGAPHLSKDESPEGEASRPKVASIREASHSVHIRPNGEASQVSGGRQNYLHLSRIGDIKIKLHRPIEGEIKRLNVKRSSTGKWFAAFTVEYGAPYSSRDKSPRGTRHVMVTARKMGEASQGNTISSDGKRHLTSFATPGEAPLATSIRKIGVDVGLTSFATLSTGQHIKNPHFFKAEEKELARTQRKLSLQAKGTPGRRDARKVVARVHERIRDKRSDFAHQLSREFVDTYDLIAFEDLDVKGMTSRERVPKNKEGKAENGERRDATRLARSIGDAAWSQFTMFTRNKAVEAGSRVVMVDPKNTTQECSGCGALPEVKLGLRDRVRSCPECGLVMNRDENAARNILRRGLSSFRKNGESP